MSADARREHQAKIKLFYITKVLDYLLTDSDESLEELVLELAFVASHAVIVNEHRHPFQLFLAASLVELSGSPLTALNLKQVFIK